MAKYESGTKHIPYSQGAVYARVSDLSNLEVLKEKAGAVDAERLREEASEEQIDKAREVLEKMEFTADTMSIDLPMVGKMVVEIVEREPEKLVKLTSRQSPIPLTLWIQVVPTADDASAMRVTLDAELNMFLKMAIGSKLQDGVDKFADMLAKIPYGEKETQAEENDKRL